MCFSPMTDDGPLTKHLFTREGKRRSVPEERPDSLLETETFERIPLAIGIRNTLSANFAS